MEKLRLRTTSTALAMVTAGAVAAAVVGPAAAAPPIEGAPSIDIVDTDAAYTTNSLYRYLMDQQGKGVLFGQQRPLESGLTFDSPNWDDSSVEFPNADVYAGTGEYPAIIGWDTFILEGMVSPGVPWDDQGQTRDDMPDGDFAAYLAEHGEENARTWAELMVRSHELGGINTIVGHMHNFATDNYFGDSSGRPVSRILPGGDKNEEFNQYLDLLALTADLTRTAEGEPIPMIFRPFHENTGSWFWWGTAHATPAEYKEIFRYTVEYLRDVKGVDNFLYSYSPNGFFGGDPDQYLATYPGDNWVDVLGFDGYEGGDNESDNSDAYVESTVTDLAMVTDLAEQRGKIAAFTEFGRNGEARELKVSGNKSLTFYSDLFTAIKEDPKAKRIAYMQTWANWGEDQFYVPYPAYDDVPEHEMFQDFLAFYDDPYSVFSGGVVGVYDNDANAEPTETTVRLVSPADGVRITEPTTTVRVAATGEMPEKVSFSAPGATNQALNLDGRYFTGEWTIGEENLTNASAPVTVTATYADGKTEQIESTVILGEPVKLPLGVVDDFESYGDDLTLRAAYAANNTALADIALTSGSVGGSEQAVEFSYDFTSKAYAGFGKAFEPAENWSSSNQLDVWVDPDGSNNKLVLQVNTSTGSFEFFPGLGTTEPRQLEIALSDFRDKSTGRPLSSDDLTTFNSFWVFINSTPGGDPGPSSIVVDDIKAVSGDAEPTLPLPEPEPEPEPEEPTEPAAPGVVEDFEGYADDAALRAAWNRAGASTLSLSGDFVRSGEFGAAFPYLDGFTEFGRSIEADWSGYDQLSMWVQPDGNKRKIVLQLAVGSNSYDYVTTASGSEPVELVAPFEDFRQSAFRGGDENLRITPEELASTGSLSIFIEPTDATTGMTGTYYIDDIQAQGAGETAPEQDLVATTTTVRSSRVVEGNVHLRMDVAADTGRAYPEGTIQVFVGDGVVGEADLRRGRAHVRLSSLPDGSHTLTIAYSGSDEHAASTSDAVTVTVGRPAER